MSDEMKKPGGREYTVDEILAEYGSKGRGTAAPEKSAKPKKVVGFPTGKLPPIPPAPPGDGADEPTIRLVKKPPVKEDKPIPEIVPEGVGRSIGARLHTLLRRADHFADHMYDQSHPGEEALKAEKYTPGVDQEVLPGDSAPPRRPGGRPSPAGSRRRSPPPARSGPCSAGARRPAGPPSPR